MLTALPGLWESCTEVSRTTSTDRKHLIHWKPINKMDTLRSSIEPFLLKESVVLCREEYWPYSCVLSNNMLMSSGV